METCRFVPEIQWTYLDDDDIEHDTDEGSPFDDGGACDCDKCGWPMMTGDCGWFEELEGPHGGIIYKPNFNYCPNC